MYNSHGYTRSAKKNSHGLKLLQLSRKEPYFQDSKGLHTDNLTKKLQEIQKNTESAESTESTESTESSDCTESTERTESTESTENTESSERT